MNCGLVRRHIGTFVDGELDPGTQLDFERHLGSCADCQEFLAFEKAFRSQVREAVGAVRAPTSLRAKIQVALDEATVPPARTDTSVPAGIRVFALPWRSSIPLAVAAAAVLFVTSTVKAPGLQAGVQRAGAAPVLEDVVRLHSSALPADVRGERQQVAQYFSDKVAFPVRPAVFDRSDVRLVGARLSNVRDRRAAALYYDVRGRRVTVVVFEQQPSWPLHGVAGHVQFGGRSLYYQRVKGRYVPVRQQSGLTYAFAGDLDRDSLLELAASFRVQP